MKTCLEAGVVPDAYKDILTDVKVVEEKTYVADIADSDVLKMTDAEMKAKAAEGYFVRAAERNFVYCPQGQMLRQKSIKRNGMIRYCNKLACKHCKNRCTTADFKEVDFNKDKLIILARGYKPQASDDIGDGRPTLRGRRELQR